MHGEQGLDREFVRQMARQTIEEGIPPDVSCLSQKQVRHLLYEFGVYQTELLAQNEELKALRQELETSRDSFARLYEHAPVGYVTLDAKGQILECNTSCSALLGIPRQKLLGSGLASWITPYHRNRLFEHLNQALQTEERCTCELLLATGASGQERHIRLDSRQAPFGSDPTPRCYTALTDITLQQQHAGMMAKARDAAEAANKAKSGFLANMSHEIRTPLNGVMGMLQLLQATPLTTDQQQYALNAFQSCNRLTGLLADILDLSRIEAGKLDIHRASFDVAEVLQQVQDLFLPLAKAAGVTLSCIMHPILERYVFGDAARLLQVLTNLVGNALKFTSSGSVVVEVSPLQTANPEERRLLFSVADTGIGIPDDKLASLFLPFSQLSQGVTREYQGAGLGLAICKRLVNLMGGTIAIDNTPGNGITVYFTIVCTRGMSEDVLPEVVVADAGYQLAGLNILVAEDDKVSGLVAAKLLAGVNACAKVVETGTKVLAALRQEHFDLVLMDVQMPVMDGVEATRAIRNGEAGEENKNLPIIAMTAYAMAGDKEKFLQAGMNGYVSKPVSVEGLIRSVKSVMDRKP